MARATAPGTAVERLADHLLEGVPGEPLAAELTGWLAGSARFRTFAEAHRDKIRKKLRSAVESEALRDVRAELQAAHLLLADRRIELAFEAYGSGKRGPDFTVTFRGERPFNLEVTRLRRGPEAGFEGSLLTKLRQLPPSAPNAVLVAIEVQRQDLVLEEIHQLLRLGQVVRFAAQPLVESLTQRPAHAWGIRFVPPAVELAQVK